MKHTHSIIAMTRQGASIKETLMSFEMLQEALIIALIAVLNLYN